MLRYRIPNSLFLAVVLCLLCAATGFPTQNITIEVPDGTTNHGDPHLLCTPTKWTDIVAFFLFNYVSHAATVVTFPGQSGIDVVSTVIAAVLFPISGVVRGLNSIMGCAILAWDDELKQAVRSGALCMLVRSETWKPHMGDFINDALVVGPSENENENETSPVDNGRDAHQMYPIGEPEVINDIQPTIPRTAVLSTYIPPWMYDVSKIWIYIDTTQDCESRTIFGMNELPDGYSLAFVPRHAVVLELEHPNPPPPKEPRFKQIQRALIAGNPPPAKLLSSYSTVRGAAALLQAIYAFFTLYRSRGDQISRYGYAAFGLTVAPYALMSTLNLVANLVTPSYPTLYLVKTEVMEEAERRRGSPFNCVVGRIETVVESGVNDATREDPLNIAGSFEDNDELLHILSPGAMGEKLIVTTTKAEDHNPGSYLSVYVPACPRFQRTDNVRNITSRELSKQLLQSTILSWLNETLAPPFAPWAFLRSFRQTQSVLALLVSTSWFIRTRLIPHLSGYVPAGPRFQRTDNVRNTITSRALLKLLLRQSTSPPTPSWSNQTPIPPFFLLALLRISGQTQLMHTLLGEVSTSRIIRIWLIPMVPSLVSFILPMLAVLMEIAIIGSLSGFHKGESTLAQRVWTMLWLFWGIFVGFMTIQQPEHVETAPLYKRVAWQFALCCSYCAPSIGGFVVVGQMLKEYGSCVRYD